MKQRHLYHARNDYGDKKVTADFLLYKMSYDRTSNKNLAKNSLVISTVNLYLLSSHKMLVFT